MKKELICISCPAGCRLTAEKESNGAWQISGNRCPRGKAYALQELTDPRRVVTTTVASDSERMPRIPVRTDKPLPKRFIAPLLDKLYAMEVKIPVKSGEILLENVENSQVCVIFCCDCLK
jgi:CxxC motif-containing protein